ncbi:MAG: hydrogenase [Actinobacteria bacterium]|jgi:hydrogenase-4 component E|nr:hydrogenase [Actinomycetota bacterium]MCL5444936.1 hydrogenase [Actinomycetota bacterium]
MMHSAPTTYAGVADVIAVLVLLTEFAMLRAPLLRSQVRLYMFQSLVVTALAVVVAATRHIDELYVLALLSFALKVVLVPNLVLRLLRDADVDLAGSSVLGVASMTLIAIGVSAFGFFAVGSLHVHSTALPTTALAVAAAVVLVAFVLIILRSDVVSQAIGFFSLENGISVASLVVAAGMPVVVEVAFLFDLLVAVVVFGVIMRVHHGRTKTLSTDELDRLKG